MSNKKNLVRGDEAHKLTAEEASKGGKRSVEVRREKKNLKRAIEIILEKEYTDKNGNVLSGTEAVATKLFEKAMKGDVKAFEVLRDTAGQKPVEKFMVAEIDQSVIDQVDRILEEME